MATLQSVTTEGWFGSSGGVPGTPTGVQVFAFSTTQVIVAWDFVPEAASFDLYISDTETGTYTLVSAGITALDFLVGSLVAGQEYWFKVVAKNADNEESSPSLPVSGSTRSTAGVEQRAWAELKNQLQNDVELDAYVQSWKFDKVEEILDESRMPFLHAFVVSITGENYKAVPKNKTTYLNCEIHAKIAGTSVMDIEVLKFDELVKNALESNLQLSGEANLITMGDSRIEAISDQIIETVINFQIETVRFTAGNR